MEEEVRGILAEAVDTRGKPLPAGALEELQQWIASQRHPGENPDNSSALIRDRRREVILEVLQSGGDPNIVFGANYRRILAEAGWTAKHVQSLAQSRE